MNYKQFAKEFLEDAGAFTKDAYGGMIGGAVTKLVEAHSAEGHSGMSSAIVNEAFYDLNNAYSGAGKYRDNQHPIWKKYWETGEGKKLKESFGNGNPTAPLPPDNTK